jgi:hypothetical protein
MVVEMTRERLLFGFLRALFFAARYDLTHKGWRTIWKSGWGLAVALWSLLWMERARKQVVYDRIEACKRCPVYCRELQTCGDARDLKDTDPLGCFCFMPVKTKVKGSVCWLHEPEQASIGGGWLEGATV